MARARAIASLGSHLAFLDLGLPLGGRHLVRQEVTNQDAWQNCAFNKARLLGLHADCVLVFPLSGDGGLGRNGTENRVKRSI